VVAAAGVVALDKMVQRLSEDHRHARLLWQLIRDKAPDLVDDESPSSNIVMLGRRAGVRAIDARRGVERLAAKGLLSRARDEEVIRLVTHRHIDESAIERAAGIIASCPL
jgi:threonine aldolase